MDAKRTESTSPAPQSWMEPENLTEEQTAVFAAAVSEMEERAAEFLGSQTTPEMGLFQNKAFAPLAERDVRMGRTHPVGEEMGELRRPVPRLWSTKPLVPPTSTKPLGASMFDKGKQKAVDEFTQDLPSRLSPVVENTSYAISDTGGESSDWGSDTEKEPSADKLEPEVNLPSRSQRSVVVKSPDLPPAPWVTIIKEREEDARIRSVMAAPQPRHSPSSIASKISDATREAEIYHLNQQLKTMNERVIMYEKQNREVMDQVKAMSGQLNVMQDTIQKVLARLGEKPLMEPLEQQLASTSTLAPRAPVVIVDKPSSSGTRTQTGQLVIKRRRI